jgi:NodT family efflux transporter outer membrane factor (OMF) lipoprotein
MAKQMIWDVARQIDSSLPEAPRQPLRLIAFTAVLFLAACVGGCMLDWEVPDATVETPAAFRAARPKSAPPIPSGSDWAAEFRSAELIHIVEQALAQNLDIAAAVARIEQADAQARIASSALWPNVNMSNIAERVQIPGTLTPNARPSSPTRVNFFQLGLTASYEIDFWGKNHDASYAARLLADVSRSDRDVVAIATIVSVVNSYFLILATQDRIRIAYNNIRIAETALGAIKARLDVGAATAIDYSQQESILAGLRAQVPPLEETLRQTKNILAVLLAVTPESVDFKGGSLTHLHFPELKPGLPSELLLRRPDIAAAEAGLGSQQFSVLRARAAFFPSIQLTGLYGVQSLALKTLFRPEAIFWQIAANFTQPLFDGYNLQGQFMLQKGRYAELAQDYKKQILTAFSDTENALIAIAETSRQLKLQIDAVTAARRAYEAEHARLIEGAIDIATLSITETTLFQNEDLLALVRLVYFQAATSLFQAVGGGWSDRERLLEISSETAAYEADKGPWP